MSARWAPFQRRGGRPPGLPTHGDVSARQRHERHWPRRNLIVRDARSWADREVCHHGKRDSSMRRSDHPPLGLDGGELGGLAVGRKDRDVVDAPESKAAAEGREVVTEPDAVRKVAHATRIAPAEY